MRHAVPVAVAWLNTRFWRVSGVSVCKSGLRSCLLFVGRPPLSCGMPGGGRWSDVLFPDILLSVSCRAGGSG